MSVDRKKIIAEFKKILAEIEDKKAKKYALKSFLNWYKTADYFFKRIYAARIITFVCAGIKDRKKRKEIAAKLRILLRGA